ncbi:Pyrophosphatase [Fragilaria crotonensis]|nr:Pyrophosphatase [Fragilaria crotonensis]
MSESSPSPISSSSSPSVLIVGSANQDLTAYTCRVPRMGETILGQDFSTSCGGKGANQAVAAAALLSPMFVGQVGQDVYGKALLENFRTAGVLYDEETIWAPNDIPTGVASIMVDITTGDNTIVVVPGANHALTAEQVRTAILRHRPKVVLAQLEVLPLVALEAMKVGKQIGATTILNPAPALLPGDKLMAEFYNNVDILTPNETELRLLYDGSSPDDDAAAPCDEETMAQSLLDRGIAQAVVVTLGSRGAMVVSHDKTTERVCAPPGIFPHDQAPPVVETVGAGDCFCGALAAYLSTLLLEPSSVTSKSDNDSVMSLAECARLACGMASLSIRKRGAQSSYPSRNEVPDVLKLKSLAPSSTTVSQKGDTVLPTLTFVTGNQKKLEEVRSLLGAGTKASFPFELVNRNVDLMELQGNPLDIAKEKCRLAAAEIGGPVLTEDTSLCFNALGGLPGPYIKWFLEKCGHGGLNDMLVGFSDKSAYAQTIFAFTMGPGHEIHLFEGRTDGTIVRPRGDNQFGWDPIFQVGTEGGTDQSSTLENCCGKTYAEMSSEEKNAVSHRAKSMAKLQSFFAEFATTGL